MGFYLLPKLVAHMNIELINENYSPLLHHIKYIYHDPVYLFFEDSPKSKLSRITT
jgi:hypothetical protein